MSETTDRSDAIIMRWVPDKGLSRRFRFEPRSDGRYERIEEVWSSGSWRHVGAETIDHVVIEHPNGEVSPDA